ncbi:hypothetical protein [Mycobacterium tuberculosis]|uniref:hypothetical protein n=1 Tax=Mycobacterium tuberculosis TaxID=1773 RepID=UPI0035106D27
MAPPFFRALVHYAQDGSYSWHCPGHSGGVRHIIREAKSYLDSLAPPFFRALVHYAQDGSYSWHCPGHSGGVATVAEFMMCQETYASASASGTGGSLP